MLLECAVLQECGDEYYTADSLNTIFQTIPETCKVEFPREVGFFCLIWHNLLTSIAPSPGQHNWAWVHYAGGPRRPPPPQLQFRRSRDLAHASIPLAQTPWGLTGRAWLQAGAQRVVIAVDPSFNSLGIDSRNEFVQRIKATLRHIYLCRTANMPRRTCVVVKQIQSNPIWIGYVSEILGLDSDSLTRFLSVLECA